MVFLFFLNRTPPVYRLSVAAYKTIIFVLRTALYSVLFTYSSWASSELSLPHIRAKLLQNWLSFVDCIGPIKETALWKLPLRANRWLVYQIFESTRVTETPFIIYLQHTQIVPKRVTPNLHHRSISR
jgi:hypothetical protein